MTSNKKSEHKDHFDCADVEKYVQQYLDNVLDEEKRRLFEEHIEYCLPCDKKVEFERKFKEIVRLKVRNLEPPEKINSKLKNLLKNIQ
jgi:anti-sigma factor (TIGR02949 family)